MSAQTEAESTSYGKTPLDEIETLSCKAEKIRRQAEVTEASQESLSERLTQFQGALDAYTTARRSAETDVEAAREQLDPLTKQLRCKLSTEESDHITHAWEQVQAVIDRCPAQLGAVSIPDHDRTTADEEHEDATQSWLLGRIREIEYRRDELDEHFQALVDEQTELPQRATLIRQYVDQLATDASAETAVRDRAALYARALIARWRIRSIWRGFGSIQAYMESVEKTYRSLLKAYDTIVRLEGAVAELQCRGERAEQRCNALRSEPLNEVMRRYGQGPDQSGKPKPSGYSTTS